MFNRSVFISYSSTDQDKAGFLASRLGAEGFEVFFAPESIRISENWRERLHQALAQCDIFIVLLSQAAKNSIWVKRECEIACHRNTVGQLRIFPLIVEEDIEPFDDLTRFQYQKVVGNNLKDWDRIATDLSKHIQTRRVVAVIATLFLLTIIAILLETWIGSTFYYVPIVLILTVATIAFIWFKFPTRSKRLSSFLFFPLAAQLFGIGASIGNLRYNEAERAHASAFALCQAANKNSFEELWTQFASARIHPNFVTGLRGVLHNQALSPSSKINALVALTRLNRFDLVAAKLVPHAKDNSAFFDFARKFDWWLTDAAKLNWLLAWLDNGNSRFVIWAVRTLGAAHETIKAPPLSADAAVRTRLLRLLQETESGGIFNNCRWALANLGATESEIGAATKTSVAMQRGSLMQASINGLTLVRANLPGQPGFFVSDTEITTEQFAEFANSKPGLTTSAEKQGVSSCFGENGVWFRETCTGASWKDLRLPVAISSGNRNLPVVHVSWIDAVQFCNWLSRKEGLLEAYEQKNDQWHLASDRKGYRLLTIKEWQAVSQADTDTPFWWACIGEHCSSTWWSEKGWQCFVANLPDASFVRWKQVNAIAASDNHSFQAPVRTFAPNDWGLFETVGNVGEWCDEDEQAKTCQEYTPGKKPRLGGSWGDDLQAVSATSCRAEGPATSHVNVGFRVLRIY